MDPEIEDLLRLHLRPRSSPVHVTADDVRRRIGARRQRPLSAFFAVVTLAIAAGVLALALPQVEAPHEGAGAPPAAVPTRRSAAGLSWSVIATTGTARYAAAIAADDRYAYVAGGITGKKPTNVVERLDASTGTWEALAGLGTSRANAAAAISAGRLYVFGGWGADGGWLDSVEVYDPTTGTWSVGVRLPEARALMAAATALDGTIYLFGGATPPDGLGLQDVLAYDPRTSIWHRRAPMPTGRAYLAATLGSDGRIYAIGGKVDDEHAYSDAVESYDPVSDRWARHRGLPEGRNSLAAARGPDGSIYAIGGLGGDKGEASAATFVYDNRKGQWSRAVELPEPRQAAGAVTVGDRVLVIGGCCATGGAAIPTVLAASPVVPTHTAFTLAPGGDSVGTFADGPTVWHGYRVKWCNEQNGGFTYVAAEARLRLADGTEVQPQNGYGPATPADTGTAPNWLVGQSTWIDKATLAQGECVSGWLVFRTLDPSPPKRVEWHLRALDVAP